MTPPLMVMVPPLWPLPPPMPAQSAAPVAFSVPRVVCPWAQMVRLQPSGTLMPFEAFRVVPSQSTRFTSPESIRRWLSVVFSPTTYQPAGRAAMPSRSWNIRSFHQPPSRVR